MFISTPSVARDLLHLTQKLHQGGLRYWGFSYGTFLGLTFASLYPDSVERMVLDGNVDAEEYSSGNGTHYLMDTDKVMSGFYNLCFKSGPKRCPFYSKSPSEIEIRLNKLLEFVRKYPVIVPGATTGDRPDLVTYSTVRRVIASSLYRPISMFPLLASALLALESGDGSSFQLLSGQNTEGSLLCSTSLSSPKNPSDPEPEPPGNVPPEDEDSEGNADASIAILCSDNGNWAGNVSLEVFGEYVQDLEGRSKSAGATMGNIALGCVGWNIKAKWRFTGKAILPQKQP